MGKLCRALQGRAKTIGDNSVTVQTDRTTQICSNKKTQIADEYCTLVLFFVYHNLIVNHQLHRSAQVLELV